MIPAMTIPEVGRIHVMIVMVSLSKGHKRHEPAVPARVRPSVWLPSPQMTNGVDTKGRIKHGERAPQAGKKETTYATSYAIVEKANDKCAGQAGEDQEGVMLMLPDCNGVVCDARGIFGVSVLIGDK